MTLVRSGLAAWGRLFLAREDPAALGALRIALVGVFLVNLLSHVGAVGDYFSAHSTLTTRMAREAFPDTVSLFFWIDGPYGVRVLFVLGVLAHVGWLVGAYTRVCALASWIVWMSLLGRQPWLYSLADQLLLTLCTWLMLTPSGGGLSVDALRGRGQRTPVWARRLIQLQLAVLYITTGAMKTGMTWRSEGTALYYALAQPYTRHFAWTETLAELQPWVLRPLTWVVLTWELGFAVFVALLWLREAVPRASRVPDLRPAFLGFGVLMHLGIAATMFVVIFSPLVLAAYLAFLRPRELRAAGRWVSALRR